MMVNVWLKNVRPAQIYWYQQAACEHTFSFINIKYNIEFAFILLTITVDLQNNLYSHKK